MDDVRLFSCGADASWTFSGRVTVLVEDMPAPPREPVSIGLFASGDPMTRGELVAMTDSDEAGAYELHFAPLTRLAQAPDFLHLAVISEGYDLLRATSESGGVPHDSGWLAFQQPASGSYPGNDFLLLAGPMPSTFTPSPTPSPTGVVNLALCPARDAFVSSAQPTTNYGLTPELVAANGTGPGEPDLRRILLYWDLNFVPGGAVVDSAIVELLMTGANGLPNMLLSAYPLDTVWDEDTVDWDNQPGSLSAGRAQTVPGLGTPGLVSWDVTSMVRSWFEGTYENHGLVIKGDESATTMWERVFESGELQTNYCPRLILSLRSSRPVPTLTSTATPTPSLTPTQICPHADEDDNTFAGAKALTSGSQGYLCPSGDSDYWRFNATNLQNVVIGLATPPGNPPGVPAPNYNMCLLRPNGSTFGCSTNLIPSYGEYLNVKVDATGQWRVRVFGATASDWSKSQPYTLTYQVCNVPDEAGPDVDSAELIDPSLPELPTDNSRHGYICPEGDHDMYRFSVSSAYPLTITVDLTNLPADYDLELIGPNLYVAATSANSGTLSERIVHETNQAGGYWYVHVYPGPWNAFSATQPYKLDVQFNGVLRDLATASWEVTQAIQNLDHDVALIAGKTTYVRVYGRQLLGPSSAGVECELVGSRGGASLAGSPLKPVGGTLSLAVGGTYDRRILNDGWLFLLPASWTNAGTIQLRAEVDPRKQFYELNRMNNEISRSFYFDTVPSVPVVIYRIAYDQGGTTYKPPFSHATMLADWIRRAYPVSDLQVWYRSATYTKSGPPSCSKVNSWLKSLWWDNYFHGSLPLNTRFYGMVDDGGGFMRGCAPSTPANVASGPTGTSTWGWDFDGSFGDWYGAHELGHAFGREHAEFCDAEDGAWYPHPDGRISGALTGNKAIFGFNVGTLDVYGPNWRELMTYCNNIWISDYTYSGLMGHFQPNQAASSLRATTLETTDRLAVAGVIDVATNQLTLDPLFVIPDATEIEARTPGPYAIVLRSESGAELARYPFTPDPVTMGPPAPDQPPGPEPDLLVIGELVPYVATTTRVDIEGPAGLLTTITAGLAPPNVSVSSPNGGETLDGDPIIVSWSAYDPDGDVMAFSVQYSVDNGASWETVAQTTESRRVELDPRNIAGTDQGLFRVWASDGIHSANDRSDGPFSVPNRPPQPYILSPVAGRVYSATTPISLVGGAADTEEGTLGGEALTWLIHDQQVATGGVALVDGLAPGPHQLDLRAQDGAGAEQTASIALQLDLLRVPSGDEPILDGDATDVAYARAPQLRLAPYSDGSMAEARVTRTASDLWLAFTGLELSAESAEEPSLVGVLLDSNYGREAQAQSDDRGYCVNENGQLTVLQGDGLGEMQPLAPGAYPTSYDAVVSRSETTWAVELRIPLQGLRRMGPIGLAIVHHGPIASDSIHAWPHAAAPTAPQTWAATLVGEYASRLLFPLVYKQ